MELVDNTKKQIISTHVKIAKKWDIYQINNNYYLYITNTLQ